MEKYQKQVRDEENQKTLGTKNPKDSKEPKSVGPEVTVIERHCFWEKGSNLEGMSIPWAFENEEKEKSIWRRLEVLQKQNNA